MVEEATRAEFALTRTGVEAALDGPRAHRETLPVQRWWRLGLRFRLCLVSYIALVRVR